MSPEIPNPMTLELIEEHLYAAVLCDALDSIGYRHQSPRVSLPFQTSPRRLAGRCKTTLWSDMYHEDPTPYELELQAVDSCQPGEILIAAAGGSMRSGIWGELLTTAARNQGCVGAIVHGAIRDVDKIEAMDFPVLASGTCLYDSQHRQRVIDLDVPVEIDGVTFAPGDLVVADRDGIVVVPQQVEQQTLKLAWEKVHAENVTRDAIKEGMKAADAYEKYGVL